MNNVMKFFGGVLWVLTIVVLLTTAPVRAQVAPTDTATTTPAADTASSTPPADTTIAPTTDTATSTPATDTATTTPATDTASSTPATDTATTTPATNTAATTTPAADVATTTPAVDTATSTVPTEIAHIAIRLDGALVGPFAVDLSAVGGTGTIDIAPTGATTTYAIPARSVLALLTALDATHEEFAVTDLSYYSSFGAFYLKCITLAVLAVPSCDQWTYMVNGTSPWSGMDSYTLQNGDTAYLYFGSKHRTFLATSTVVTGAPFVAVAQVYDPVTNTLAPLQSVVLGVTQYDPANPWTPIEVATSTVNQNGEAIFSVGAAGSYSVGIKDDYYWPATTLVVLDPQPVAEPTPSTNSGGSGSTPTSVSATFDTARAFAYLASVQSADGSFGADMFTDWVAVAFGEATAPQAAKEKLRAYMVAATPVLVSTTDYERHAMALQAMHIDPRTGTLVDYIKKITDSFDGTQMGDAGLVNDDIFAVFSLLHAGYTIDDDMIKKVIAFIVVHQEASGSWGSVDMTAAAVQALALVPNEPGVAATLVKAKTFLQSEQQSDGGFGNSFATSWVMQAIAALGESPVAWVKNGKSPADFLLGLQQTDGGMEPASGDTPTRVWATAYAVPAVAGKPWHTLMHSFAKPAPATPATPSTNSGGVTGGSVAEVQPVATTTPVTATSTLALATTTPPLATSTLAFAATSTSSATPKTQAPRTQDVKAKPIVPTLALIAKGESSKNQNQQASVPENKGSSVVTHFFSSVWGGVVTVWKWLF